MGSCFGSYGVQYELIDGNFTTGDKLLGYCKVHKGLLTKGLICTHRCRHRREDGSACEHFIPFVRIDNRYQSKLKGDEFRATLGKKGRKSEREKFQSDTVSETSEISSEQQADNSVGCVEQVGDIQIIESDIRIEENGGMDRNGENNGDQLLRGEMHSCIVQVNFSRGVES